MRTLRDLSPDAGYIRSGSSLDADIQCARTDGPIGQLELINGPRSADYESTLGEVRIGKRSSRTESP